MSWQDILLWIGIAIELVSLVYYIFSIVRGETRPHPITWAGWTAIGAVGTWAARSGGAGLGLYIAATFVAVTASIFVISLIPGYGHSTDETSPTDPYILVLGLVLLALRTIGVGAPWLHATLAVVGDGCFAWFTFRKAIEHPKTEPLWPWLGATLSAGIGLVILGAYNYTSMAYPTYLFVGNAAIAVGILVGRARKRGGKRA